MSHNVAFDGPSLWPQTCLSSPWVGSRASSCPWAHQGITLELPVLTPFGIESATNTTDCFHPAVFHCVLHTWAGGAWKGHPSVWVSSDTMGIIKQTPFSEHSGVLTTFSHHELENQQQQLSLLGKV